jgi:hypothetical protein
MKEIPYFPCAEPDLAKTIKIDDDRVIIEKPRQLWDNPWDYVVQVKYDGVRCLVADNDHPKAFSAEGKTPKVFNAGKMTDYGVSPINWWSLSEDDNSFGNFVRDLTTSKVEPVADPLSGLFEPLPTRKRSVKSGVIEGSLKYVSREDKTRNRVNLELITADLMSNSRLGQALTNQELVLDGEIWSADLPLEDTTGMWASEKIKPGYESLKLVCFDCYWVNFPELNYPERMNKLYNLAPETDKLHYVRSPTETPWVLGWMGEAIVGSIPSNVTEDLQRYLDDVIATGEEGLIIRKWKLPYNCGRTGNNLYKLKSFEDSEFTIVDVIEGMGKFTGVPIWVCDNGVGGTFKVTAAGTQAEKEDKWRRRASFMGKPLKVKYERIAKTGTPLKPISLGLRTSL